MRPTDLPKAVRDFPKLNFCAYHSGYFFPGEHPEGKTGISEFIEVVQGMPKRDRRRVYAEIGSTFAIALLSGPDQAAHLLGQLLKVFGSRRILWGTDSMWWGSPQFLIDAFVNLEIPVSMQQEFGYPALTKRKKARILGGNAARLYKIRGRTRRNLREVPPDAVDRMHEAKGGFREDRSLRAYGPRRREDYFRVIARDHRAEAMEAEA